MGCALAWVCVIQRANDNDVFRVNNSVPFTLDPFISWFGLKSPKHEKRRREKKIASKRIL